MRDPSFLGMTKKVSMAGIGYWVLGIAAAARPDTHPSIPSLTPDTRHQTPEPPSLSLAVFVLRLQRTNDRRVGEGRGIAQCSALGDVAQEPSHDLARSRLRQLRGEDDVIR